MSQSFVLLLDQFGCIKSTQLRAINGIQWLVTSENEENGYERQKVTLFRANKTNTDKLCCAELKAFRFDTSFTKLQLHKTGGSYNMYSNANDYLLVKESKIWTKFEDKKVGFVFNLDYSDFLIKNKYPEALQITLIPVIQNNTSELKKNEIQAAIQNKSVQNFDKLSENMGQLLRSETMADVVLKTDTCSVKAHKAILAARSSVFQRMFSVAMKEAVNNMVKISDIKDDVLKAMLSYIYTSAITFKDMKTTRDLYVAADKYYVIDLKDVCSSWLKNMTVDSAVNTLILADDHSDQYLKSAALEFIASNYSSIKATSEWKALLKERLPLAIEFLSYKIDIME